MEASSVNATEDTEEFIATNDPNFGLTINIDQCGECVFCLSVCPFEALSRDEETKEIILDQKKCRMCGICSAACPSRLIDMKYYSVEGLTEFLQLKINETGGDQVTIACRGTALNPTNWKDEMGIENDEKTIFFTLPCLGRINLNFLMKALELGIQKITLISCEEEFCRNKDGSKVANNKFLTAQTLFEDVGYYPEMIDFKTRSPKAVLEEAKCIACGTCAFLCPYDAITIENAAKLDKDKCMGCGICVSGCPAVAITLEGSAKDAITKQIEDFAAKTDGKKILVLGCQWSEYNYVDKEENEGGSGEGIQFLNMPCSGRIEVVHILKALSAGIDGILLSICLDDICSLEDGNKWSKARVIYLKSILEKLGLSDRIEICSTHPKYVDMFENQLNQFKQKLDGLDPNPLKEVVN